MALAALPEITVERLILNDVSPQLHAVGMRALGQHLAQALKFASFAEGAAYVRKISGGLGPHSDTQWDTLARNALRQNSTGSWEFHYDPALSVPLLASTEQSASQGEQDLWRLYDALAASATLRILLLRGQESALLSKDVAAAMLTRGPRTTTDRSGRRRPCAQFAASRSGGAGAGVSRHRPRIVENAYAISLCLFF